MTSVDVMIRAGSFVPATAKFFRARASRRTDRRAEIQAALDAGFDVVLGPGWFRLNGRLQLDGSNRNHQGRTICGAGRDRTFIDCRMTGDADDPLNFAFGAIGTIDESTCNTTITDVLYEGQGDAALNDAGSLDEGQWLLFQSYNGETLDLESDGEDVQLSSMAKVLGVDGDAVTITPAVHNHVSGATARRVKPVVDLHVCDLTLDATGSAGRVAVGVLAHSALRPHVERVGFKGFSRFGVELDLGTDGAHVPELYDYGANNGLLCLGAAHRTTGYGSDFDPAGARYHTEGVPRGKLTLRNRPSCSVLTAMRLGRGCFGVREWGGQHNRIEVIVEDMDATIGGALSGYERAVASGEFQGGQVKYGVVKDGVSGPLDFNERPFDNEWTIKSGPGNVCDLSHAFACLVWEHDTVAQRTYVKLINRGRFTWEAGLKGQIGYYLRDAFGGVASGESRGMLKHIVTDDAFQIGCRIDGWDMAGGAASPGHFEHGFVLGHQQTGMLIRNVRMANIAGQPFIFASTFSDYGLTIESVIINGQTVPFAVACRNESGVALAPGMAACLIASAASTRKVRTATAADESVGVWVGGYDDVLGLGKGWGLFAPIPARPIHVLAEGTIHVGDEIGVGGTDGVFAAGASIPVLRALEEHTGAASLVLAVAM